jgi:DNA-binding transcriptional ArsR family regulator
MNKIDYLGLDGNTLTKFLTVLEEMSVSRAAERLGVTQSAVSHTLDKLPVIFDDPLFVRVGRGIESTARARALQSSVASVLDDLKSLTDHRRFDPLAEQMDFTIAANDFPIHFIFPKLLKELSDEGIDLQIRFIPSGIRSCVGCIVRTPDEDFVSCRGESSRKPPLQFAQIATSHRFVQPTRVDVEANCIRGGHLSELAICRLYPRM